MRGLNQLPAKESSLSASQVRILLYPPKFAPVAQRREHLTSNQRAVGSNPTRRANGYIV